MITYRSDFGLWWPNYDHAPEKCHAMVRRHLPDMDVAIRLCPQRRMCVQAGGHVGLWPMRLALSFLRVLTFEPEPALFQCLQRNIDGNPRIGTFDRALSSHCDGALLRPSISAGSWRIDQDTGTVPTRTMTIDRLNLPVCDALFLDVEGHEPQVLAGARKTIAQHRPIIHVEELPRAQEAIRAMLRGLGYRLHGKAGRDFVYVPK